MFPVLAALVAAMPLPSPTPTVVPQIAHVVTSDRGIESAQRTARTTYVVTAAQITQDGDRTAVSYTHLDVYKRQVRMHARAADSFLEVENVLA